MPGATRFAVLANPNAPSTEAYNTGLRTAAAPLGRQLEPLLRRERRFIFWRRREPTGAPATAQSFRASHLDMALVAAALGGRDGSTRGRYDRSKLRYPSDLTDDEWAKFQTVSLLRGSNLFLTRNLQVSYTNMNSA